MSNKSQGECFVVLILRIDISKVNIYNHRIVLKVIAAQGQSLRSFFMVMFVANSQNIKVSFLMISYHKYNRFGNHPTEILK